MTIWGRLSSCNVQKALWALEELALPYARIDLGGDFGGLDDPAYRAMNPHGRVPTIKDGDVVVWESDAVVRYLCATYGVGTLWPEDPAERALADQWMTWGTVGMMPDWIALFWRLVRTPPERRDAKAIARHHAASVANFELLDRHLAGRRFVAGDAPTMADMPFGMMMYRWYEMEIERPDTPNVDAYYGALLERPAYRKAVCIPYGDLVGKQSF
ncbi:MAG: glutathione S-transferase [Alphaproteobacteria bacterium]|nr:glutathione S-transferase [Alphaproteobacteria bacterium]